MAGDLVARAADPDAPNDRRFYGVAVATVVDNVDLTSQARVQLRLPWMPEISPWARVAALLAGPDTGTYFLPQPGDEVLVAFHHGDPSDVFVIGSLWNGQDRPPASTQWDPQNKFRIRTPLGHDLEFDDLAQSVTLTTTTEHTVTLTTTGIQISTAKGTAKVTLGTEGQVTINAAKDLSVKAARLTLEAPKIELKGSEVAVNASSHCGIKAATVDIN